MVVRQAVRRHDYLSSNLPYNIKVSDISKQKYNMLILWIMENIDIHECQTPEYRKTGCISFQFLSKKHMDQFQLLLTK